MIFAGLVIFISFGLAMFIPSEACAASAYLADEIGNTEINVDVDEEFSVVLWAVDVTPLAGYDCKITISGPATAIGQAAHGDWFADGHTVYDGLTTIPADYNTAMLVSPTAISGSGDVVVFTLHADDDGVVAINVDSEYFFFANTSGGKMYLLEPSTLYVTVGTGESFAGGAGGTQEAAAEDAIDSTESTELDDPETWWLWVESWRYVSEEQYYWAEDAEIVGVPESMGGTTIYVRDAEDGSQVTLTAPLAYYSYDPPNWSGWLAFHHWRTSLPIGGTTDHPTGQRSITFVCEGGDSWACAIYREEVLWVDPSDENAFGTIQDAIDAVPESTAEYAVVVVPGTYQGEGNRNCIGPDRLRTMGITRRP